MINKDKYKFFLEQLGLCAAALFYTLFGWQEWWAGVAPRLIRGSEERNAIYHAHHNIGATLLILICVIFIVWLLKPNTSLLNKLKLAFAESAAKTALSLFLLFAFGVMIAGLGLVWATGEEAKVLGIIPIPHFFETSMHGAGYLHSAFSSVTNMLFSGIAFVFLYCRLKDYMKPGLAVALLLLVHLLINLPKPPSLHPIANFATYILTPLYYLSALAIYCWCNKKPLIYWPIYTFFIIFLLYLPYFAFKILPPWHPQGGGEVVLVEQSEPLIKARSAEEIFPDPESLAQAEKAVSWCMQCHNVKPSDAHLLGPNLVGVFNRQAGSVEGYGRYSKAMVQSGNDGNIWTRESLGKFLTDGQNYIPGNLMNQQTDFSDAEKLNLALDYLEYISTQ